MSRMYGMKKGVLDGSKTKGMLSMSNASAFRALIYVVAMWPDRRFRDTIVSCFEG